MRFDNKMCGIIWTDLSNIDDKANISSSIIESKTSLGKGN